MAQKRRSNTASKAQRSKKVPARRASHAAAVESSWDSTKNDIVGVIENEGGVFFRYGSIRGGFKIKSATVYPSKVENVIELVAGVKAVACVVTDTVEGPLLTAAVVPEEDYFYDWRSE